VIRRFGGPGMHGVGGIPFAAMGGIGQGAANWWEAGGASGCLAAYQPKGAADYASSKVNLANPGTYDAYEGIAPAWAADRGWIFDGTMCLLTGIMPALTYTIIARFANVNPPANNYILAAYDNVNAMAINEGNYGKRMWWRGSTMFWNGSSVASGVQALANRDAYMDGVFIDTLADAGSAPTTQLVLGAFHDGAWGGMEGDILAAAIYDHGLTSGKILAVTTAVNVI